METSLAQSWGEQNENYGTVALRVADPDCTMLVEPDNVVAALV